MESYILIFLIIVVMLLSATMYFGHRQVTILHIGLNKNIHDIRMLKSVFMNEHHLTTNQETHGVQGEHPSHKDHRSDHSSVHNSVHSSDHGSEHISDRRSGGNPMEKMMTMFTGITGALQPIMESQGTRCEVQTADVVEQNFEDEKENTEEKEDTKENSDDDSEDDSDDDESEDGDDSEDFDSKSENKEIDEDIDFEKND